MQLAKIIGVFMLSVTAFARSSDENSQYYDTDEQQVLVQRGQSGSDVDGAIVILTPTTDEELPEVASNQLVNDLKGYVENSLQNKVKYTYDTLFYGLAVEFTHPYSLEEYDEDHSNVEGSDPNANTVLRGLYKALYNYKSSEIKRLKLRLDVSADSFVHANQ